MSGIFGDFMAHVQPGICQDFLEEFGKWYEMVVKIISLGERIG